MCEKRWENSKDIMNAFVSNYTVTPIAMAGVYTDNTAKHCCNYIEYVYIGKVIIADKHCTQINT